MSDLQPLAVREKQELAQKEEKTVPGRHFVPVGDIFETDDALTVILEMPGIEKKDVNIGLENDVLRIEAQIDFSKYQGMEPVYTEYTVGHYARKFTLSNKIDRERIAAHLEDDVLMPTLPKAPERNAASNLHQQNSMARVGVGSGPGPFQSTLDMHRGEWRWASTN